MVILLAVAAAVTAAVMVWAADLPLRPLYWRRKRERISVQGLERSWENRYGPKETPKRLEDVLFLAGVTARDLRQQRTLAAAGGTVLLGGAGFLLAGPLVAVPLAVVGGAAGWFMPLMSVRGKASEFRFQLQQALPQFLSLTAMAMTSLALSDSIAYAAAASDHRAFRTFRQMIPPPNSTKSFGEALFDFGKRYDLPELANRGTILRTAAQEGGKNIRDTIQRQATDCRKSTNASLEEAITGRVTAGTSAPLAIIMALFVFILYPVSQQVTVTGVDAPPRSETAAAVQP